jgi:signal transduction histidine kinase
LQTLLILEKLAAVPFFSTLPSQDIKELVKIGHEESFEPDCLIFSEGDPADRLCVVLDGAVIISRRDDEGGEILLDRVETGGYFGEIALLDGGNRSASARTPGGCTLFSIARAAFQELLGRFPQLASRLLAALSRKLRGTNERLYAEVLERRALGDNLEVQRHRAVNLMVAGVAHELNTPLGLCNTAAGMIATRVAALETGSGGQQAVESLEEIRDLCAMLQKNLATTNRLIQSFRNISASQLEDVREELDLLQVVKDTAAACRATPDAERLDIKLESELPEYPWTGFRGHVGRALLNILDNVVHHAYGPDDRARVLLRISSTQLGHRQAYEILIQDFGAGIAAPDLPHVLEVFFTRSRSGGRKGLGLSIVHSIVTGPLQGRLEVRSTPSQGTEVRFKLPRTVLEEPPPR